MSSGLQIDLPNDINDLITNEIIRLGLESEEHQQLMREIIDYHNQVHRLPIELQVVHCSTNTLLLPESWPQTQQVVHFSNYTLLLPESWPQTQ